MKKSIINKKKWGIQKHDDFIWHTILAEEIGEVAKAILEYDHQAVQLELIQCAAVIKAWLTQPTEDNTDD